LISLRKHMPAWARVPALPPAWTTRLHTLNATGIARWHRMSVRERRLVGALVAVAGVPLVYLVLVEPAWRTIDRHAQDLPALRAQAARVDALVQESIALRGQRSAQIAPQALQTELTASLNRAALGGVHGVKPLNGTDAPGFEVTLTDVTAAALFDWMGHAPSQLRLTLTGADLGRAIGASGKAVAGKASGTLKLIGVAP